MKIFNLKVLKLYIIHGICLSRIKYASTEPDPDPNPFALPFVSNFHQENEASQRSQPRPIPSLKPNPSYDNSKTETQESPSAKRVAFQRMNPVSEAKETWIDNILRKDRSPLLPPSTKKPKVKPNSPSKGRSSMSGSTHTKQQGRGVLMSPPPADFLAASFQDDTQKETTKLDISHKMAQELCSTLKEESAPSEEGPRHSYLWAPIYQYAPALERGFPLKAPLFSPHCLKWKLKKCQGKEKWPMLSPCTYWAPMPLNTKECFGEPPIHSGYVSYRPPQYNGTNCPCKWPCTPYFDPIQQCRIGDKSVDLQSHDNWQDDFDIWGYSKSQLQIPHYKALQLCRGLRADMGHQNQPFQIDSIPIRIQSISTIRRSKREISASKASKDNKRKGDKNAKGRTLFNNKSIQIKGKGRGLLSFTAGDTLVDKGVQPLQPEQSSGEDKDKTEGGDQGKDDKSGEGEGGGDGGHGGDETGGGGGGDDGKDFVEGPDKCTAWKYTPCEGAPRHKRSFRISEDKILKGHHSPKHKLGKFHSTSRTKRANEEVKKEGKGEVAKTRKETTHEKVISGRSSKHSKSSQILNLVSHPHGTKTKGQNEKGRHPPPSDPKHKSKSKTPGPTGKNHEDGSTPKHPHAKKPKKQKNQQQNLHHSSYETLNTKKHKNVHQSLSSQRVKREANGKSSKILSKSPATPKEVNKGRAVTKQDHSIPIKAKGRGLLKFTAGDTVKEDVKPLQPGTGSGEPDTTDTGGGGGVDDKEDGGGDEDRSGGGDDKGGGGGGDKDKNPDTSSEKKQCGMWIKVTDAQCEPEKLLKRPKSKSLGRSMMLHRPKGIPAKAKGRGVLSFTPGDTVKEDVEPLQPDPSSDESEEPPETGGGGGDDNDKGGPDGNEGGGEPDGNVNPDPQSSKNIGNGIIQLIPECPGGWPCYLAKRAKRESPSKTSKSENVKKSKGRTLSKPASKNKQEGRGTLSFTPGDTVLDKDVVPLQPDPSSYSEEDVKGGGGDGNEGGGDKGPDEGTGNGGGDPSPEGNNGDGGSNNGDGGNSNGGGNNGGGGDKGPSLPEDIFPNFDISKMEKGPGCNCDWPCLPFFDHINKCYSASGDLLLDENDKPLILPIRFSRKQKHFILCLSYHDKHDINCYIKN